MSGTFTGSPDSQAPNTQASNTSAPGSRPKLVASRRELLIGGGFVLAAATAFAMKPRTHLNMLGGSKIEALVPQRFAGWSFLAACGLVLPPEDQLEKQLYSELLTRTELKPTPRRPRYQPGKRLPRQRQRGTKRSCGLPAEAVRRIS